MRASAWMGVTCHGRACHGARARARAGQGDIDRFEGREEWELRLLTKRKMMAGARLG